MSHLLTSKNCARVLPVTFAKSPSRSQWSLCSTTRDTKRQNASHHRSERRSWALQTGHNLTLQFEANILTWPKPFRKKSCFSRHASVRELFFDSSKASPSQLRCKEFSTHLSSSYNRLPPASPPPRPMLLPCSSDLPQTSWARKGRLSHTFDAIESAERRRCCFIS